MVRSDPRAPGRLRRGADIRGVRRSGRRLATDRVVLYVRPSGVTSRAAFVCARPVGGAVARNRARRLLREAWRSVAPRLTGTWDVVLVARPEIKGAGAQDVTADVTEALSVAGMISR